MTALRMSESFLPLKGGSPLNKMYRMTPSDQISHF